MILLDFTFEMTFIIILVKMCYKVDMIIAVWLLLTSIERSPGGYLSQFSLDMYHRLLRTPIPL